MSTLGGKIDGNFLFNPGDAALVRSYLKLRRPPTPPFLYEPSSHERTSSPPPSFAILTASPLRGEITIKSEGGRSYGL